MLLQVNNWFGTKHNISPTTNIWKRCRFTENNWVRRIVGVRRPVKTRTDKLRVKERFKTKLVRSRMKWSCLVEHNVRRKTGREQFLRKWKKWGEEDQYCDWRTSLRETMKEWENNGEQQQQSDWVDNCLQRTWWESQWGKRRRKKRHRKRKPCPTSPLATGMPSGE